MNSIGRNLCSAVTLAALTSAIAISNTLPVRAVTLAPDRRIDVVSGKFLSGYLETDELGELTYSIDVSEISTPEFLFPAITYDSSLALNSFEIADANTLVLTKTLSSLDPSMTDMLKFVFPEGLEEAFALPAPRPLDRRPAPPWWRIIGDEEFSPSIDEPHPFLGLLVLGIIGAGIILKKKLTSPK